MAGGDDVVDVPNGNSSIITDAMVDNILRNGEENPSAAVGQEGGGEQKLQRVRLAYTPTFQRFRAKTRTFTQQYSHMYTNRLRLMRPMLEAAALAKWGTGGTAPTLCKKVIDLVDGAGTVMVVGTLFKDMPLRPSLLDEYRDEAALQGALQPAADLNANYVSADDTLVLEDESGRVNLAGPSLAVGEFVTGLVVAVKGQVEGGVFIVADVCFAGWPPQEEGPGEGGVMDVDGEVGGREPRYVLLASGFKLSEKSDLLPLQMLVDYVQGHVGSGVHKRDVVSRIGRVIVAGDLLAPFNGSLLKEKHMTAKQQEGFALPFKHLDLILAQLASAVPLDVMPGASDPSNCTLPQQPIPSCLLPHAARYTSSFHTVPNPYEFWLGGDRLFLGGSGQVPEDMARYITPPSFPPSPASSAEQALRLMEKTLEWRHLAPTAPDTLACYPFCDDDPFVLPSLPHVYFVGNQPAFATSMAVLERGGEGGGEGGRVRVVCVPSFAETGTVVLLELNSLTATPLKFGGLPKVMRREEGEDKGEGGGDDMEEEEN